MLVDFVMGVFWPWAVLTVYLFNDFIHAVILRRNVVCTLKFDNTGICFQKIMETLFAITFYFLKTRLYKYQHIQVHVSNTLFELFVTEQSILSLF